MRHSSSHLHHSNQEAPKMGKNPPIGKGEISLTYEEIKEKIAGRKEGRVKPKRGKNLPFSKTNFFWNNQRVHGRILKRFART
jgi:hypothetical protein